MAKQAALAFVKRTLERCHKFEETGKSCFSEPLFRDMFLSRSSNLSDGRSLGTTVDEESGKLHANTSSRTLEARVSGIFIWLLWNSLWYSTQMCMWFKYLVKAFSGL